MRREREGQGIRAGSRRKMWWVKFVQTPRKGWLGPLTSVHSGLAPAKARAHFPRSHHGTARGRAKRTVS